MHRPPLRAIFPALLAFVILAFPLAAAEIMKIAEIGAHEPILIVRKNVHPQNLMVVYTKVDASGHFLPDPDNPSRPILDFYWLMDGKAFKPVNGLIKNEIRKRLELQATPSAGGTRFAIDLNDLKEVNSDIQQPKIDVSVDTSADHPAVEAEMNLGPSDGNMRIRVSSIYTEGRAFPPAVYSVTVNGEEIAHGRPTGRKITRKYEAKESSN